MRRNVRCLAVVLALVAYWHMGLHAQQQDDEEAMARHAVKASFLSPLLLTPQLSYEYCFHKRWSVELDLGGTLIDFVGDLKPKTCALFAQPQLRHYVVDQCRVGFMPFIALGLNYTHAWEHLDLFVRNEGWNIVTTPYTLRDDLLRLTFSTGVKINATRSLSLEGMVGFMLFNRYGSGRPLFDMVDIANHFATLITTRVGWVF